LALAHTSPSNQRDFNKRRSASTATVMLRCTDEEVNHSSHNCRSIQLVALPLGMAEIGTNTAARITITCAAAWH